MSWCVKRGERERERGGGEGHSLDKVVHAPALHELRVRGVHRDGSEGLKLGDVGGAVGSPGGEEESPVGLGEGTADGTIGGIEHDRAEPTAQVALTWSCTDLAALSGVGEGGVGIDEERRGGGGMDGDGEAREVGEESLKEEEGVVAIGAAAEGRR